jgi:hypothetical protein
MTLPAILASIVVFSGAYAAEEVSFQRPDTRTATLLPKLLRDELTRRGSGYEYNSEASEVAETAWVKLSEAKPPYLFIMLHGSGYCGSGGCAIYGFRKTKGGWRRIYFHFGGEGIELLNTTTDGHRDIRQDEPAGEGRMVEVTSRWNGSSYRADAER